MTVDSDTWDADSTLPSIPEHLGLPVSPATSFTVSSQIYPTSSPPKREINDLSDASQQSTLSPKVRTLSKKKKKLTGPIIPRRPRIKTENKNYLLDTPESTAYYVWHPEGRGQIVVDESDYKRVTELLLRLDFANFELATSSSNRWINEVRSSTRGSMSDAWGQTVIGTKITRVQPVAGAAGVNTLTMGLVRKKRKSGVEELKATPVPTTSNPAPQVNVLSAAMIKKKPKV
jgi:regulator of Ty1 transposition protein 109